MSRASKRQGQLGLGLSLAAAAGRVVIDRIEEMMGRGLPRTPEQLAKAAVVNQLLRDFPPLPVGSPAPRLPKLRAVSLPGVSFESSNCTNFLIDLDFETTGSPGCPNPRRAYAKIPCSEFSTRVFANAIGFWEVEETFCARIASRVPVRVPQVYAVARRGARFVLLLENLHDVPGARMFINRDMAAGTTIERARMCLRTFAELHAAFWGWSQDQREALLPARLQVYLAPGGRAKTRALNEAAIEPAHRRAPDLFRAEHVEVCRLAIRKWEALVDAWYDGALTLVHGDSHLANLFEYQTAEGPKMGMIDFQGMHWCKGIRDVQYFLINSLEPDLLAIHEEELIDFYINQLASHGVVLDPEQARYQYRGYSFQTLMVAATSIGLGTLTESDHTVRTLLRRSLAAIERLDLRSWLEAL